MAGSVMDHTVLKKNGISREEFEGELE
jgi:hypothetical protein